MTLKAALPPLAALLMIVVPSCNHDGGPPANGEAKIDFASQIRPILTNRCINCHHSGALFGNLNLENRSLAFKERPGGPVILPHDPAGSAFLRVLTLPEADRKAMPPTGHRIPDAEVTLIRQWIEQGADWPEGPDGVIKPMVTSTPTGAAS